MQETVAGLAVIVGGLLHGSFATPMKRMQKRWRWENIWLLYSVAALAILPAVLAILTVPSLAGVYRTTPLSTSLLVAAFGLGWGIGSVLFGQAISRIGMALGFAIILGITSTLGSLLPLIVMNPQEVWTAKGRTLMVGLLIAIVGIVICSAAGAWRDRETRRVQAVAAGGRFLTGLLISIASGITSPMLNFGFAYGEPLRDAAKAMGARGGLAANAVWAPALLAGFLVNGGYASYLLSKNRTWRLYTEGSASHWLGGCLMAVLWFGGISIYGVGAADMGRLGAVVGWPVFMATVIIFANVLGFIMGEWRCAPAKVCLLEWLGIAFLVVAILVVSRVL